MSDTEKHFGRLVKVERLEGETLQDTARRICESEGTTKLSSYNKSWTEELEDIKENQDTFQSKYIIYKDDIYLIDNHKQFEYDATIMMRNADGSLSFYTEFYNGGTCLGEILEELIEEMDNTKQNTVVW